jgi:serine/threonine-protein kinase
MPEVLMQHSGDSGARDPGTGKRNLSDAKKGSEPSPDSEERHPEDEGEHLPVIESMGAQGSRIVLRDAPGEQTPVERAPAPKQDPEVNDTSRYQIGGEIAKGGVGIVLRSRDKELGRDVAMKLLRPDLAKDPLIVERFVEEAQIGAQLQHPGVVPVYELGLMADERPFFTMKLVKGRTLAAFLSERERPTSDLRKHLGIFEQVCQTMAYAHTREVVHRDLKPSNIMVGAYGEVQIVDWGFAKVRSQAARDEKIAEGVTESQISIIETIRSVTSTTESIAGSVMGTPAYMPPEQAMGNIEGLDQRADVFSLGSILCEILTGLPPYTGEETEVVLYKAARGRLEEAHERLDRCKADSTLVELAKSCMTPAKKARPQDAGVLARVMSRYLSSVEERAAKAQIAAAQAKVKAEGERKARRLTMAIVGAVLGAALLVTGAWLWFSKQAREERAESARALDAALEDAARARGEAEAKETVDPANWEAARAAAEQAVALTRSSGADEQTRLRAEALLGEAVRKEATARAILERDELVRRTVAMLAEIRTRRCSQPDAGSIDGELVAAFRGLGLDPTKSPPEETAEFLARSPIREELSRALSELSVLRSQTGVDPGSGARLLEAIQIADPDRTRSRIRMAGGKLSPAGRLRALREVVGSLTLEGMAARSLDLLGNLLGDAGSPEDAVAVLRIAAVSQPEDLWTHLHLAHWLSRLHPPRTKEALLHCTAALAMRPESVAVRHQMGAVLLLHGEPDSAIEMWKHALELVAEGEAVHRGHLLAHVGEALLAEGKHGRAESACRDGAQLSPEDALVHQVLGRVQLEQSRSGAAAKEFRAAIDLQPGYEAAHRGWIRALAESDRLEEAIRWYRAEASRQPRSAATQHHLGLCLAEGGELVEAVEAYEKAIGLEPGRAGTHRALAIALLGRGEAERAILELRKAVALRPGTAESHRWLGIALAGTGDLDGAVHSLSEAARLSPRSVEVQLELGTVRHRAGDPDGALVAFRRAVAREEGNIEAHLGLGAVRLARGEPELAVQALRELRLKKPDHFRGQWLLAQALRAQGRLRQHVNDLTVTTKVRQDDGPARLKLGLAREAGGNFTGAMAAYREAIARKPDLVEAHARIGRILEAMGEPNRALSAYQRALDLRRDHAEASCRMGVALLEAGRFANALPRLREGRGADLLDPFQHLPSGEWLREAGRMAELEPKLDDILSGGLVAGDAEEMVELARLCQRKGRQLAAATLFRKALAETPGLALGLVWANGIRAARAAALVGCGRTEEARGLDPEERAIWRKQALTWLQDQFAFLERRLARGDREGVLPLIFRCVQEPDLAGVREEQFLSALSAEERETWQELWTEMHMLLRR